MPYVAPGAAFSNAFEESIYNQQQQARQAQQDKIAQEREARLGRYQEEELRQGRESLDEKRREADLRADDRRRSNFEKRLSDSFMGDIPDAGFLKEADDLGMGHLFPPDPKTGHRAFAGTRQEREQKKERDAALAFAESMPPGPERSGLEYFAKTGKQAPAGMFTKNPADVQKPVYRVAPNSKGQMEKSVGIDPVTHKTKWEPAGGDIPKDAVILQETNPPQPKTGSDNAAQSRLLNLHERGVTELNKWAQPYEAQEKSLHDLARNLKEASPAADSVVADLVYKSLVTGPGSGARMNNQLIERIMGGRSKWETFKAKLQQWSTDPKTANSITPEQRTQLRSLGKGIMDNARAQTKKVSKFREQLDDAYLNEDQEALIRTRTQLQNELNDYDESEFDVPDAMPAAPKVPNVGDTYNGSKVVSKRKK